MLNKTLPKQPENTTNHSNLCNLRPSLCCPLQWAQCKCNSRLDLPRVPMHYAIRHPLRKLRPTTLKRYTKSSTRTDTLAALKYISEPHKDQSCKSKNKSKRKSACQKRPCMRVCTKYVPERTEEKSDASVKR
jgi:hypothetical protein